MYQLELMYRRSTLCAGDRPPEHAGSWPEDVKWAYRPNRQAFDQRLSAQAKVLSDVAQDASQRPDPEGRVPRNSDMMFTALEGGQPNMAAGLTAHPVAEVSERLRGIVARDVPRQSQAVMTSSRTKWRRIILGSWLSSKWQRTASRTLSYRSAGPSASVKMDSPRALAVKPPSGASSTRKINSDARRLCLERFIARLA
jgi:hypothetical protein